ncbi:uncharacterized protein EI90DRAFT_3121672 [Cantharellus anzutake]|uniref:uncharacterized protein n=1 Tax=Cantharellus anzutake TaxID=1750568 RepID=UPI001903764D|nr:uncharacterized protein EI90DRAFT_3121672 [Cantharellus anzutake]KAF8333420.1 hypothetical protein EI90DRAFT_3121672 [Cantharellus anzutake]
MSSSQNLQQVLGDPSAPHPFKLPSTVTTLEKAIQQVQNLGIAWFIIHSALDRAGDPNIKEHLRNESESDAYIESERELIELLRSMVANGTLLSAFWRQAPWLPYSPGAFLKPEPETTDADTALRTR